MTSSFSGTRRASAALPAAGAAKIQMGGYGVFVSDTFSGRPTDAAAPVEAIRNAAAAKLQRWEDVLQGYTPEQCAELVDTHSQLPMSLLWYAWRTRPEFYSDRLKTAARAPKSETFGPAPRPTAPDAGAWASPPAGQPALPVAVPPPADPDQAPWGDSAPASTGAGFAGFGADPAAVVAPEIQAEAAARLAKHMQNRPQSAAAQARSAAARQSTQR
jgi:hypothetical protein